MSAQAEDPTARLRALAAATARKLAEKKGLTPAAPTHSDRQGPKRRRREGDTDWICPNCSANCHPHRQTCFRCGMPRAIQGFAEKRPPEGSGTAEAASAAASAGSGADVAFSLVEVPESQLGLLIGKGGVGIKQIQADTGAIVCVGKLCNDEGARKVCVTGSAEAQMAAQALIQKKLVEWAEKDAKKNQKPVTSIVEVPSHFVRRVIGQNGSVINQVKDACGVTANLDDTSVDEPVRKMYIKGPPEGVAAACEQVERLLLDCYRRARIFNAPLESKHGAQADAEAQAMAFAAPNFGGFAPPGPDEHLIEEQASIWAEHYAGNLDCIDFYKKLELLQEVEAIPGLD